MFGLRTQLRKALNLLQSKAVILMYHRIDDLSSDPYGLAVSPRHFAEQMAYVRQTCNPMRLIDFLEALQQRSLPPRTVVVTFDDGYVDNYRNALPILEQTEVPATFFIATGNLGSPQEFWWDRLERTLLVPSNLPEQLQITVDGQSYVWPLRQPTDRHTALQTLNRLLRGLPPNKRTQIFTDLTSWTAQPASERSNYRSMTPAELNAVAASEVIDIGAHTVNHPALSLLAVEAQQQEIVASRDEIERIIQQPVRTFSYPFGKFGEDTIDLLKKNGFVGACTTHPAPIVSGDDPWRLGRYTVNNWNRRLFAQNLEEFLHESH